MAERAAYKDFMATSVCISHACNLFESVRCRIYRQIGWAYDMQLPIASTGVEESLCVAKASTCNDCNKGYVSMPKSSYLVWKGFVPIKCSHGGEIRNLIVDPDMLPEVIEQV